MICVISNPFRALCINPTLLSILYYLAQRLYSVRSV